MSHRDVDAADAVGLALRGYRVSDVRAPAEWDAGHVTGATLLPLGEVGERIREFAPDRATPLLLHCAAGGRSGRAAARLVAMGYTDVVNLNAPIGDWKAHGGAWDEPVGLTEPQRRRYARQVLLPEIGVDGQRRLLDARVLIIGAGGLGSPAAM